VLYCDYAYPNATCYIAPIPRLGGTMEIWMYLPITQFATVNDAIDLPPGYEAALRYNFALALRPEYPRSQVDPTLPAKAKNYKASIVQLTSSHHLRNVPLAAALSGGANAA